MIKTFLFLCLFALLSCASGGRDQQTKILNDFNSQKFDSALTQLELSEIKKSDKMQLLYMMEKGTIFYYQKDYFQATQAFVKANELVDRLFTKSIKEQIASSILNDNAKTFYGSIFERSLLYYYQAMSFYQLANQDSYIDKDKKEVKLSSLDKKRYLNSARSSLLAWDSFFSDLKRSYKSKSILIEDLTSKLIAARLHEQMNLRSDLEISLQLYKDAYKIFKRFAPSYKVFNTDFKNYNKSLKSFLTKRKKLKRANDKTLTENYQKTKKSIQTSILRLTKKLRPGKYKKLKKEFKINPKPIKHNKVDIVVEVDGVNRLKSKKFSFNLNTALKNISNPTTRALVEGIGVPVLTYFALGPLGLGYVDRRSNRVSVYSSHNVGTELVKELGVEFDLPSVDEAQTLNQYQLNILDGNSSTVASKDLTILNSIDDLSYINAQEMLNNSFKKRSLRVGLKYVAAITAAYATYKTLKKDSGDFIARSAAFTQFLLSAKAIRASERADDRHWATLPGKILEGSFDLADGEYTLELVETIPAADKSDEKPKIIKKKLGVLSVNKEKPSLYSYRSL